MFRNKGIIGLGIVLAFFILISLIFSDIWIENELENMGDQIVGAKVEIDNLNLSFTELNLSWGRLQVTNPENTMKNMFGGLGNMLGRQLGSKTMGGNPIDFDRLYEIRKSTPVEVIEEEEE